MRRLHTIAVALSLTLGVSAAQAVIIKLTTLKEIFTQSTFISTASVEALAPDRPGVVLTVDGDLKGKLPVRRLALNMKGDKFAEKEDHTGKMFKRLEKGLPLLLFVTQSRIDEKKLIVFAYTNGTWFQAHGQKDGDDYRWSFLHCETYFTRTFKGTTGELKQIATDFLEKKKEPPAPNKDEKPGYGPEVSEKKSQSRFGTSGLLFGVIVGLPAGGLIGFLALLFPALFGGLPTLMKGWLPLVTAIFTTSTLFSAYLLLLDNFKGTMWADASMFWMSVAAVNLLCLLWGWRRSLKAVGSEPIPARTERWTIVLFSGAGLLGLVAYWFFVGEAGSHKLRELMTRTSHLGFPYLLVLSAGFWMGGLYLLLRQLRKREGAPGLPSDAIILWSMTVAGLVVLLRGVGPAAPSGGELAGLDGGKRSFQKLFQTEGQADVTSAPAIDGNLVYLSVIEGGFAEPTGAIYCVDRSAKSEDGSVKPAWAKPFTFDGKMKQPLSSPVVADGRVFVGEGFHIDQGCHLFCLDAKTGELLWKFQTNSHTESTACVAGDRVVFGAGDDGIYCLEAKTGAKVWQYPGTDDKRQGLHVDSSPVVEGDRVYISSGNSNKFQNYRVVCLELSSGKKVWECDALDLPAWGTPAVAQGRVFVGLSNGRLNQSNPNPRGAMLCLDARDGRRLWRFDAVTDGIHTQPVVDSYQVYFGARDSHAYAVDVRSGELVWKTKMSAPVVSSPALARSGKGMASSVYFAAADGTIACLDARTGEHEWPVFKTLTQYSAALLGGLSLTVERSEAGEQRRVYFAPSVNNNSVAVLYCLEDFRARRD